MSNFSIDIFKRKWYLSIVPYIDIVSNLRVIAQSMVMSAKGICVWLINKYQYKYRNIL